MHPFAPRRRAALAVMLPAATLAAFVVWAATTVPTDVQIPGTQPAPLDAVPVLDSSGNCGCHDFTGNVNADTVPVTSWAGAMMANAGRDPLFWSTVAIAEQDFLPSGGGVGDLCLHCHSVKGWVEGRSTPTNGSGLVASTDGEGIMCEFCHLLANPDQANSIPNPPEGSYVEEQHAPFLAYDQATGEGYYGGAEYVLNSGGTRMGPYRDHGAKHNAIPSTYHRDARLCGTCHDVSNPAVGDLAPNHGALAPFTGPFSGVVNGPVAAKAAMNNKPHTYGIVERTFSEWVASGLDTLRVNDFATLPDDLKVAGGTLEMAWRRARWGTCSGSGALCNENANCLAGQVCNEFTADYQQPLASPPAAGEPRYFTCQTCHMAGAGDHGAQQGRGKTGDPWRGQIRPDLPRHDQSGMSYWIQEAVKWQDDHGTLRFGGGLTAAQWSAMQSAMDRSETHLRSAATLSASQAGNRLEVKVTNLTGHKLISGYPEGRRMWLHVEWRDAAGAVVAENGAYGPLGNQVTDRQGVARSVESILDPSSTKVYEAKPAMTQDWAAALIGLGYSPAMVLEWDRMTNMPVYTLGDLAAEPAGTKHPTFHFVLNNDIYKDNRIPPYLFSRDEALERNTLPVPGSQFGDPAPGGVYDHFDVVSFPIPAGAASVEVDLLYQATSWEYIQFLWKQNAGTDPFLGQEGVNMLDAWLNTGMAEPLEMASVSAPVTPVAGPPGQASGPAQPLMEVAGYDGTTGAITLTYAPACDATGHTIHYGPLTQVKSYGWAAAACAFDTSGTALFVPDSSVGESIFWVVVGHGGAFEGSYGTSSGGVERPASLAAGACSRVQSLATVCE
jgi:hypothetical protein